MFRSFNIRNYEISNYQSFYIWLFKCPHRKFHKSHIKKNKIFHHHFSPFGNIIEMCKIGVCQRNLFRMYF